MVNYLMLRTSGDIDSYFDEYLNLATAISEPDAYQPSGYDEDPWRNGTVLRFFDDRSVKDIALSLSGQLMPFECWLLFNGRGSVVEKYPGGPAQLFLDEALMSPHNGDMALIFLVYHPNEQKPDELTDRIRAYMQADSRSVFYFENGRILMAQTNEPASLLPRMLERFRNDVSFVTVCGWGTRSINPGKGPKKVWHSVWKMSEAE